VPEQSRTKSRKDKIMEAALQIFARKNFQETTIVEISKQAGVSEATIYEYFGTKEDLLLAIPEKITKDAIAEVECVLPYIKGAEEKIRAILRGYIHLYETNPDYSALVLLQLTPNKRFRQTKAHSAIREAAHIFLDCIREGIADGTFKENTNPYLIRSMLLGTIEHLFIRWHLQEMSQKEAGIMDLLDPFMDIVLGGIRARRDEPGVTLRLDLDDARLPRDLLQAKKAKEKVC
jgi:TetR/AcrR family transcriptional regulator, fatty acid metabolism regulator protein